MELWLYDEGGWPSGSACGKVLEKNPLLARKQILSRKALSPYVPGKNAIAAFCNGQRIYEGYTSDKEIREYYFDVTEGNYPNLFEAEATEAFIDSTHEKYKKSVGEMFGKTVTALFTDVPVADKTSWCKDFP